MSFILFLDSTIASSSLKQLFTLQQANRSKQLQYLQDLSECRYFNDFFTEYPIPTSNSTQQSSSSNHQPTVVIDEYDHKFILELIDKYPRVLDYLPIESYSHDQQLIQTALLKGWSNIDNSFQYLNEELTNHDSTFLWKLLQLDVCYWFRNFNEKQRSYFSIEQVISLLEKGDYYFIESDLSDEQIKSVSDRSVILDAIINRGLANEKFVKCFSGDREICLQSIKQFRYFIRSLSDVQQFDWKNDREALDAILNSKNTFSNTYTKKRVHLSILECLPHLRDDQEFVMKIIDRDPASLELCSVRLKGDREIAIRAISNNPYMIDHVHASLLNDREVIVTAISKNGQYLGKASTEWKSDRELVLLALNSAHPDLAAQYVPESLANNDPEIRQLMIKSGYIHKFDTSTFTREEIISCVSANGFLISKFPTYFQDEQVVIAAITKCSYALQNVPEQYRTVNVLMEGVKSSSQVLKYVPEDCPFIDKLAALAVKSDPSSYFYYLNEKYRFSMEEFKELVLNSDIEGRAFRLAPEELKNDRDFALMYVKRNAQVYSSLNEKLKNDPIIRKEAVKNGLHKKPFIPLK